MHKTLSTRARLTSLLVALLTVSCVSYSAELPTSKEPLDIHSMSKETKDIIWGFMRELGLPNPFEQPKPKPEPPPGPKPTPPAPPAPPVEVTQDDDFLWEDDNFLDDKRSFDEVREGFDRQYRDIKARWDKQLEERLSIWRQPTEDFLNFYDAVVSQTEEASAYLQLEAEDAELTYSSATGNRFNRMQPGDFHVIPQSMEIPIRNQGFRGTCVAFAYVRGMESILASYGAPIDLSENHFYWLAKHECRTPGACTCTREQRKNPANQCVDDGLVPVKTAQLFRQKSTELYTVKEAECRYNRFSYPLELTGAPLSDCKPFRSRVAKPRNAVPLKTYPQILESILNNEPLVIGVRVSKKMMAKQSTPTQQRMGQVINTLRGDAPDDGGHAMLGIGIIKLQQKHWNTEGRYCLITANSWGQKFGVGGYTCFTENWLREYLTGGAVALRSLDVQEAYYPKQVY